jgi:hypothetical protein
MLAHYDFVNPDIMSYFSRRLTQAPRDAGFSAANARVRCRQEAHRRHQQDTGIEHFGRANVAKRQHNETRARNDKRHPIRETAF